MLDLHDCTDKLLQLSIEQKALAQECNFKCANDLLQGSLRLSDICSTAKDCLLQSKKSICDLKSIILRRKDKETGFTVEGVKYLALRKQMKKKVPKALQNMKNELLASSKNDNNTSPMLSFLKETEAVTLSSLEHLLLFISGSKGHSKHSRWSAISKLVQPKRVVCDSHESNINGFEKVDAVLQSLIIQRPSSLENFHGHMENLELCIQDLEIVLDHLSRKLIRNRGSFLSIFNN